MKFVTIRDFRSRSAMIQKELPLEKELVLTSNGKPVAIISSVTENDMEEALMAIRRARTALAMNLIQRESAKKARGSMPLAEVNAEIKEARKRRK